MKRYDQKRDLSYIKKCNSRKQTGVALISVMLLVAFLVTIIGYMLESQYLMIRQTKLQTENEFAYLINSHAESWAIERLIKVATQGKSTLQAYDKDSLDEQWTTEIFKEKINGVEISAQLYDLNGLFNLNNLEGGKQGGWYDKFNNFLIDLDVPLTITDAIVDWIDVDTTPSGFHGKEDYSSDSPPKRTANQKLKSVEELLMITGITQGIYDKLSPFVTALDDNNMPINLNTAPLEVVKSLLPPISATAGEADSFITKRQSTQGGFDSKADVIALPIFNSKPQLHGLIKIKSDYFELRSTLNFVNSSSQAYRIGIRRKIDSSKPEVQFDIIYRKRNSN